ncbi:MAG: sigma-54 dependent transcriptional regulator, partial [Planctomycetota bacterium]|nr:sigma-54 dependent transcriptional regulator [Planctomycetota bacterium]
ETAVEAMRLGAYTYLTKPFEGDELVINVKRAIEHARLKRDNAVLRLSTPEAAPNAAEHSGSDPSTGVGRLIGDSHIMRDLKQEIASVAKSHGTVLVHGESGVGKEVVARAIHEMSPRRGETFLAMNCAALSESLLESELFGHEKGAFTGAERLRKGRFELADRGTLLLDEISEISPRIQAKLLRVLQERGFERVGASVTIHVDARVIATTNRHLPDEVEKGAFRQDLFFRLNVLPIYVPPLRERADDIPLLARHFVKKVCDREGREVKELGGDALSLLAEYRWPGNVRELQNICERAVVLSDGDRIGADLIRGWLAPNVITRPDAAAAALERARFAAAPTRNGNGAHLDGEAALLGDEIRPLEEIERQVIVETLQRFDGHRQKTARALGIGVRTLGLKLKKWKEASLVSESL